MAMTAVVEHPPPGRLFSRVLRLLGPHRRRLLLLALAILVGSAVGVAAPLLTKQIFDRALFPGHGQPRVGLLALLVGLMMLLILLGGVFATLQTYLASVIGQLVMHGLRDRLYRHLQWMSLRFFTSTRTGEIQSRIANDVGGVGDAIQKGALSIAGNFVFLLTAFVTMAVLAWQLALLSFAILPVFALVSFRVGRVRRRIARETQETLAEMSSITQETLSVSGALHTKVFDRQAEAVKLFGTESLRLAELGVRQQMVGRVFLNLAQTFFLIAPGLTYLGAGIAMRGGAAHFTPGTLVAFTALQIRLFSPVRDLLDTSMTLQASAALFERIFQYLDLPHEILDSPGARPLEKSRVRGAVAFDRVWFRYARPPAANGDVSSPRREWTLGDVSLKIAPGQLAALVGPSGAGKTTLSYLVARLYDVDRGSVTIDGVDVRDLRLASLADVIGMVTQETYLFHASIRDNLRYARPEATQDELEAAARLAFIHDQIVELADGYDAIVGERGYRMSGGEKQRIAIARAILKDPRILILDEATSALDTSSERLVQAALRSVTSNRTTIAIAHRLSTILAADVIFVLDRGRVIESGTHAELLARGATYARLYEEQFRGGELEARFQDGVLLSSGEVVTARTVAEGLSPSDLAGLRP
jgi:ATP-binding cassette, subfamily B, bacterial